MGRTRILRQQQNYCVLNHNRLIKQLFTTKQPSIQTNPVKTPQTQSTFSGQPSLFNWRWTALLVILACLLAGRATAGTLTVSSAPLSSSPPTPINLSAEGDLDWAHYGSFANNDYDHKAGVTPMIGYPSFTGTINQFNNAAAKCSWVDGVVEQSMAGTTTGTFIYGAIGVGYQWTIPASTTPVVLHLYLSTYLGPGQLTFTLSDGSAPTVVTNIAADTAQRVTATFAANSAAQTLTVDYVTTTLSGNNIALMSASLSSAAALPLSVPQPQLGNGTTLPTGSTFRINANPTGVAADGSTAFGYQWQVSFNGGGYTDIPGATNNPLHTTAGAAGSYNYRVVVTNSVLGGAAVTSTATTTLTVTTPTGTIGVSSAVLPTITPTPLDINLTTEGATDWAYWGLTAPSGYDTRANVIGTYTQIGTDSALQLTPTATSFTWTDATTANNPVAQTRDTAGMIINNGYELSIPALTTPRLVNIYVAVKNAYAYIEVSMSDNSAPLFEAYPTTTTGTLRYSIAYNAATTGKTLKVRVKEIARFASGGLVALQAASLEPVPTLSVSSLITTPGTNVLVGQPLVFSLKPFEPYGAPPFTYVWQRDTGTGYTNLPDTGSSAAYAARSTVGTDNCRVIVTGSQGSVTSAPTVLTVNPITSTLVVSRTPIANGSTIALTPEGILDWKHWGFGGVSGVDRKATGGGLISDYTYIGVSAPASSTPPVTYTWTDGTPNATGSHTGGIKAVGAGEGFQITVPAESYERVLNLYNTLNSCTMHFEASMSDNSAYMYSDDSWSGSGNNSSRWQIRFSNSAPGTYLRVRFWDLTGLQVVLNSATLTYGNINVQVEPAAGGQVKVSWPVGTLLEAPAVTGPWTTNLTASPYLFTPTTGSAKFFRAIIY